MSQASWNPTGDGSWRRGNGAQPPRETERIFAARGCEMLSAIARGVKNESRRPVARFSGRPSGAPTGTDAAAVCGFLRNGWSAAVPVPIALYQEILPHTPDSPAGRSAVQGPWLRAAERCNRTAHAGRQPKVPEEPCRISACGGKVRAQGWGAGPMGPRRSAVAAPIGDVVSGRGDVG